jgi:hypothetical protein
MLSGMWHNDDEVTKEEETGNQSSFTAPYVKDLKSKSDLKMLNKGNAMQKLFFESLLS